MMAASAYYRCEECGKKYLVTFKENSSVMFRSKELMCCEKYLTIFSYTMTDGDCFMSGIESIEEYDDD